jgi:hypothetical protein
MDCKHSGTAATPPPECLGWPIGGSSTATFSGHTTVESSKDRQKPLAQGEGTGESVRVGELAAAGTGAQVGWFRGHGSPGKSEWTCQCAAVYAHD